VSANTDKRAYTLQIMLVFTIVTVFFVSCPSITNGGPHQSAYKTLKLPLSFMSSVFAIQIDAFPHDPTNGDINWPLKLAMALICEFTLLPLPAYAGTQAQPTSTLTRN
jgi:hypothetical protein